MGLVGINNIESYIETLKGRYGYNKFISQSEIRDNIKKTISKEMICNSNSGFGYNYNGYNYNGLSYIQIFYSNDISVINKKIKFMCKHMGIDYNLCKLESIGCDARIRFYLEDETDYNVSSVQKKYLSISINVQNVIIGKLGQRSNMSINFRHRLDNNLDKFGCETSVFKSTLYKKHIYGNMEIKKTIFKGSVLNNDEKYYDGFEDVTEKVLSLKKRRIILDELKNGEL